MDTGYIMLHRRIVSSDIYKLPPLYLRVFERLLLEANHKDNIIPYKDRITGQHSKKLIKRGERMTSLRQVAEWVAWYERGILKVPNVKTIKQVLDWLIENDMIKIYNLNESNRNETHYIIVNYNGYQSKGKTKVTEKKQSLDTNNNDKECKEKNYLSPVVKLFMVISGKDKSNAYSLVNKLLKYKAGDGLTYLQKCLMLMYIIRKNRERINESKYIGILTNQYRETSYSDFKNTVFSEREKFLINNNLEIWN